MSWSEKKYPEVRSLRIRYIAALSLIAVLTVAGQIVVQFALTRQADDAEIVNVAGRQRMLSQKIAKEALLLLLLSNWRKEGIRSIHSDIERWKTTQKMLVGADPRLGFFGPNSPATARLLAEVQPAMDRLIDSARYFVDLASDRAAAGDGYQAAVERLLTAEADFLSGMERIVAAYSSEAEAKVNTLRRIEIGLMITTLTVLCLEAAFVFQPATDKIKNSLALFHNELVARRARERELSLTSQKLAEANERLKSISLVDGLTGIANRRRFDEVLDREWRRARRENRSLAVILIDIDFFKYYNDTFGHLAGDECLTRVAGALSGQTRRPADLVARYGGEEFAVILPDTGIDGAMEVAEAMRRAVAGLGLAHPNSLTDEVVTISLGLAAAKPLPGQGSERLVRAADEALYLAKRSGRNRAVSG